MEIVAPLISLIGTLADSIITRITATVRLDQSIQSLRNALEELMETRDDLRRRVDQAGSMGLTPTNQVRGWLERAEEVEAQVGLIIRTGELERRCCWCCNANCCLRYKLTHEVGRQLRVINALKNNKILGGNVADQSLLVPVEEIPSRPAFGLEVMLEKARSLLREEEVGIIGIYGMGGVGKTTLLKSINNNFLSRNHDFDVVIWAVVSKDFVAEKIQQAIGGRLGLSWDEIEIQEQRASNIYKVLRRKKFLLLLDDVWEGIDLEKIGIPIPDKENKCKVAFTARSMDVCSDMDAHCKLKVDFLKEEAAWQLFGNKVGRSGILNSPSIKPYAETIVRKCGGLPLALITIGRAMANKETEDDWRYAVDMLNSSPTEVRGMTDVFTLLKFSYDNLGNDTLRLFLLYCSLYPEGYSVEIEQLVEYWAGEVLLDSIDDGNVRNMGHAIVGSLKVACFLETGEEDSQVKMHDVVRSFALWIASECGKNEKKHLVRVRVGLTEAPTVDNWEEAHRISFFDNEITELSDIPFCPHLSTLLLQWNTGLSKISYGFFQFMPVLKVLDLSFTSIREIPGSICKLAELSHLDLSGTKLSTLPKELGGLKKLRHLDLRRTLYLRTVPREAVSGLRQLRVLNFYYSYGFGEVQDSHSENEVRFSDLDFLQRLTTLGITVTELTILKRLNAFKSLLKCIQYLYICECEGLLSLQISSTAGGERLRRLSINNCFDLNYLVVGSEAGKH
ncbi:hypothetical protein RJ639_006357 [Escallonia herrerae]|uniref:AAA+ ATPase domain-containing protein n=1 Tax=Escallonia herrerae TaxID=1293975 RepID=A0AA88VZD3_9ASTE|nr:hypothetical protein RJ639_006357 [Escallonia herrerae]